MLSSSPTTVASGAGYSSKKPGHSAQGSMSSSTVRKRTSWRSASPRANSRPRTQRHRQHGRTRAATDTSASEGGDSDEDANGVPAPVPGMYWMRPQTYGSRPPRALRAHTMTFVPAEYSLGSLPLSISNSVGSGGMASSALLYIFGGCDAHVCFNELFIFDPGMIYS